MAYQDPLAGVEDYEFDSTETTEKDLENNGFVDREGWFHMELTGIEMITVADKPAHAKLDFMILADGDKTNDQTGRHCTHRLYLQQWEYEEDDAGNRVKDADGNYIKTGQILPLKPDGGQMKNLAKFFINTELLKPSDIVGKKWSPPLRSLVPGMQFGVHVTDNSSGPPKKPFYGVAFQDVYLITNPKCDDIVKNTEQMEILEAGDPLEGL